MKTRPQGLNMIRSLGFRVVLIAIALSVSAWGSSFFGKVIPIGGHASDIALDEGRGVLYIANYTANRVELMNTADQTISTSINVPFPSWPPAFQPQHFTPPPPLRTQVW